MIEEYIKIYCDRCGSTVLVKKDCFPDYVTGDYLSNSSRWSLKDEGAISDLCPQCKCEYDKMLHKFFCKGVKRND